VGDRFDIPEKFLRNNSVVKLFDLDGTDIGVKLLGSNRAEAWAEKAQAIDDLDNQINFLASRLEKLFARRANAPDDDEANAKMLEGAQADLMAKVRAAQKDRYGRIKVALLDYDPEVFTQDVIDRATAAQIVFSYTTLKHHTDPFVVNGVLQIEAAKAMQDLVSSIGKTRT